MMAGGRSSRKDPTLKGVMWELIDDVEASAVTFSRTNDVYSAALVMFCKIGARLTMNVIVCELVPIVDCAYTVTANVPNLTLRPEIVEPFHVIPGGRVDPKKYVGEFVAENVIGVIGIY